MLGGELHVVASFSLVLGAILGAILCSYMRGGRQSLLPSEGAMEVYLDLRQKLELLQQTLQADAARASSPVPHETPGGMLEGPLPQRTSTALAALCAASEFDPPVESRVPPNVKAWRRVEKPRNLAHHVSRNPGPEEKEMVAPVRRQSRPKGHAAAIDARTAEEIVMRHFGVPMDPLTRPNEQADHKILRMPTARADAQGRKGRQSLAL